MRAAEAVAVALVAAAVLAVLVAIVQCMHTM
jgi:hypothetical protein